MLAHYGANEMFDEVLDKLCEADVYFDTAYIYPGSESFLGEVLEKHNLREKVNITTKLPQYMIKDRDDLDKYFDEE